MATVTFTERAVKELCSIMTNQNMDPAVTYARISVKGGGCSGFQWGFCLDETYKDKTDILEEQDGIKIVMDRRSFLYLDGTTVDFSDDLNKMGFVFDNPKIERRCGCGSSFTMG